MKFSPQEYLKTLLDELDRAKPRQSFHVTHAITLRDGKLCVLVSVGDYRERVYVEDLDPDPVVAAQTVAALWRSKEHRDEDIE